MTQSLSRVVPSEPEFAGWQRRMRNVNVSADHPWAEWSRWKECDERQAAESLTTDGRIEGFPELRTRVRKVYAAPAPDPDTLSEAVGLLAESMFTADRLRKRVTPDWIGMPRDVKDEWREKARQALENPTKGTT